MKKILLTVAIAALATTLTVSADNEQVVTIGGQTATQPVSVITFSGDNLVLTFADNTQQTVDMSEVVITFTFADAIKALNTASNQDAPLYYFDLNGRQLKQAPAKGAFMMKKGDRVVKLIKK